MLCTCKHMVALSADGLSWGRCFVKRGGVCLVISMEESWFIIGVALRFSRGLLAAFLGLMPLWLSIGMGGMVSSLFPCITVHAASAN